MTTERIDVLAVMDHSMAACGTYECEDCKSLCKARAAVAELIEAVAGRKIASRRLWLAKSESDKARLSSARAALKAAEDRETAALARVGAP